MLTFVLAQVANVGEVVAAPKTVGEMVLAYVVAPLLALLGTALVAAVGKLTTYLHSKEKDGRAFAALAQASELVAAYVAKADVELRPEFQKALADGKLTPEEGAALKAKVLELLKRDMPASLMALLSKVLGGAVDGWLSGKVEQAVAEKAASPS